MYNTYSALLLLPAIETKLVGPHEWPSAHQLASLSPSPLSILLLVAIGAHSGFPVGKWAVHDEQTPWNDPYVAYMTK